MKKYFPLFLATVLAAIVLAACGGSAPTTKLYELTTKGQEVTFTPVNGDSPFTSVVIEYEEDGMVTVTNSGTVNPYKDLTTSNYVIAGGLTVSWDENHKKFVVEYDSMWKEAVSQ